MRTGVGLLILAWNLPLLAQYGGPAVLSRGESPGGVTGSGGDLHYSLTLTSELTNGVRGTSSQSQFADQTSAGGGVVLGLGAIYRWPRTYFGFDYSGTFRDYTKTTMNSGTSQGISFDFSRQLSPTATFSLRENAGMFSQFLPSTATDTSSVPFNSLQTSVPVTNFSDNRTRYTTSEASVSVQKTARFSYEIGVSYFLNDRLSSSLAGTKGETAMADVQYRLSPHVTIGGQYTYAHFSFIRAVGDADLHAPVFTAAARLSRWSEISFYGGPVQMQISYQQSVAIDPTILTILCPPGMNAACPVRSGSVITNTSRWGSVYGARWQRTFGHSSLFLNAGQTVTPGNGLFLTSRATMGSAGYSYSSLHNWTLSSSLSYMSSTAMGSLSGKYNQPSMSFQMTRHLAGPADFVSSFTMYRYQSSVVSDYNHLIYVASIGLRIAPEGRGSSSHPSTGHQAIGGLTH